jgi:ribonuclease P protein component
VSASLSWQHQPEKTNFVLTKQTMSETVSGNTFRKPEKLCSQVHIDQLFTEGKTLASKQFRLIYLETETASQPVVKVLIAVPKKKIKHAVSRNRMKRLIREAYRLSKHKLLESCTRTEKHYHIAFIFTGVKCISQQDTSTAINELLDRLIKTHENSPE